MVLVLGLDLAARGRPAPPAPRSRAASSPTLARSSAACPYGRRRARRAPATSIAPASGPIAVSIFSSECSPLPQLARLELAPRSTGSSAASIRFWSSGAATCRSENSASR